MRAGAPVISTSDDALNSLVKSLSPEQLREWLSADLEQHPVLLDVREPWELEICALPGVVAMPMQQLPDRVAELDPVSTIVCICHHGVRSLQTARYLERVGFRQLFNLEGGVDRWARCVDPEMAVY